MLSLSSLAGLGADEAWCCVRHRVASSCVTVFSTIAEGDTNLPFGLSLVDIDDALFDSVVQATKNNKGGVR